jgi:hypothetical protein
MKLKALITALACSVVFAANARADAIPYPTPGVVNPVIYSFTAAASGDIKAYFAAGASAFFENQLGLLVNGVDRGIYGLDNHTSAVGQVLDFGPVNAGDKLVFAMKDIANGPVGKIAYSDPTLNGPYDFGTPGPGANHIYSTAYSGTGPVFDSIPPGTWVGFEDLPASGPNDWGYEDEDFVFTNVAATGTPEPATLSIVGFGVVSLCGYAWRKRKVRSA